MDDLLVFQLYRRYAISARDGADHRKKEALSENEFLLVWRSLPKMERNRWEARFEAGFKQIIVNESRQYASILDSDTSTTLKAA